VLPDYPLKPNLFGRSKAENIFRKQKTMSKKRGGCHNAGKATLKESFHVKSVRSAMELMTLIPFLIIPVRNLRSE
jgi:hypothetical protein